MSNEAHLNLSLSQEADLNAKAAAAETFEQKMGFETYYKLGSKRSLAKTAEQLGRAPRTIEDWAIKGRWTNRVKERERTAAEFLLMQKSAEEEANTKAKHLTLVDASIAEWSKKLLGGEIKLSKVEDLEKLIRMRWELTNMPDKRVNGQALANQGGGMIDLRLRGMDRTELQKFLHSTLSSIQRITNKDGSSGATKEPANNEQKFNLNISLQQTKAAPQKVLAKAPATAKEPEVIDAGQIDDLSSDFEDLSLDFDLPEIEDFK